MSFRCLALVGLLAVAGAAAGPKDIPDSIVEAGAAAIEAAAYLRRTGYRVGESRAEEPVLVPDVAHSDRAGA